MTLKINTPSGKMPSKGEYDEFLGPASASAGKALVEIEKSGQPKQSTTHALPPPPKPSQAPQCVVRFGVGQTVNIGDYESIRVYVGIDMPSGIDDKSIEATYDRITDWAGKKLAEAVGLAQGAKS